MEDPLRVRVVLDDRKMLTKSQRSEGLKHCWILLRPEIATISDLALLVYRSFNLQRSCPNGLLLSIDVSQAIVCVIAFQIANFGESMIGAALQDKEGFQWVIKKMINEGHSTNKQAIVTSNRLYDDEEEPSIEEYYDDEESSYEVNKKNEEERHIRDRRAFLLHSLFVDVAIFRAIASIQYVMEKRIASSIEKDEILHFEIVGDFNITVTRDTSDASCKLDTKIDGNRKTGMDRKHLIERNLLKGITAAEKTTTHDFITLGVMNVWYCGYIAIVKVNNFDKSKLDPLQAIDIEDQPDGGSNAQNINS
ncbi:uncharacterized protein A4U43_C05F8870 [Asparagus officinalis]|uniref:Clu domain-containing protein n=1 Tax=Asparagus officinalis TaxID=4686 RepID=A0A5P1ERC9_ASPOF|nr:uncharacterized protein A4U43_C05F8870 [Asparagus officinalis]